MDELDRKLLELFPGRVVRKDLIGRLKGHLNVPAYVLEYLLGKYCSSGDDDVIEEGLRMAQWAIQENYVEPTDAELVKAQLRVKGSWRIIDKIKVRLYPEEDRYWAELVNLQVGHAHIDEAVVNRHPRLLAGGVWAVAEMEYRSDLIHRGMVRPFVIRELRPIQVTAQSLEEIKERRAQFSRDEWIAVLLRSLGFDERAFTHRQKLLLLLRLIPMAEANYNLVELGPRGTGKSYAYREISPYAILVSGGETTVPNLFYSMAGRGRIGLVGLWDTVAFDEVAGLKSLAHPQSIQIMKDYMESGSFARGREEISANASMAFLGNINVDVEVAVRTSHLFTPFPEVMQDMAFFDRFHAYLPGWEIPKIHPSFFGSHFGFVVDYLAEFLHHLRTYTMSTAIDASFSLSDSLNKRDEKAVRKTVSGFIKLLHPNGEFTTEDVREYLEFSLELRRRVKEQLKKMGGMEYWDTAFAYTERGTGISKYVGVPEQAAGMLVSPDPLTPGTTYTIGWDSETGRLALFRIEVGVLPSGGGYNVTGSLGKAMREAVRTAYDYARLNLGKLGVDKRLEDYQLHIQVVNLMQAKEGSQTAAAHLVAILSALLGKPVTPATVILGEITIQGVVLPVTPLAEAIQVARENGGRRILVPIGSAAELSSVPSQVLAGLDLAFYADAKDCVLKALGS
jgi:ATP-dependent Lon protease